MTRHKGQSGNPVAIATAERLHVGPATSPASNAAAFSLAAVALCAAWAGVGVRLGRWIDRMTPKLGAFVVVAIAKVAINRP